MSWLTKTIGGTDGLTLGGPMGEVCGRALEAFYETNVISPAKLRLLEEKYYSSRLDAREKSQLLFFLALCSLLGKICVEDEKISAEEVDISTKIMVGPLKLSGVSLAFAKIVFHQARASRHSARSIAAQFQAQVGKNGSKSAQFLVESLLVVAYADGEMHTREWRMISSIARILLVDGKRLKLTAVKHSRKTGNLSAPSEEVEKRRKQLARLFDPKTMEKKRIPPELGKFAATQLREFKKGGISRGG
ncbi:MAG: TerB family tellurite resistance protein [Nitrospinota bacterium]|nr:TerB family tellurite resistance protein [Nitrospinota bacterium]